MAQKSRKEILRNLQNAKGIKYKSADFTPKRGEVVKQAFVYYSVSDFGWTPELIYIDNDMFNWLDCTKLKEDFRISHKQQGLAGRILHYDSFAAFKSKCLDIPCLVICHHYYQKDKGRTVITPTFVMMNDELLKISDIKNQFHIPEETKTAA